MDVSYNYTCQEVSCVGVETYSGKLGSHCFQSACVLVIDHPYLHIIILNQKSECVVSIFKKCPTTVFKV